MGNNMAQLKVTGKLRKRGAIKETVIRWIDDQGLAPGAQIPSQNELAATLKTTVVTIHRALKELAAEGVLYRINGKGTFVGPLPGSKPQARTVALLMPGEDMDRPERNPEYWPYVQHLIGAFMQAVGTQWHLSVRAFHPDVDPADEARELAHYDAVFFHYAERPVRLIQYLVRRKIVPVVALGLPAPELPCMTVDHNKPEGVRKAVCYLSERGYKRLAFVGSPEYWGDLALSGFRAGLADSALPFVPKRIVRVGEFARDGVQGVNALLSKHLNCDAIFVDSDMQALGVIEGLRTKGVKVPKDIAVIGYDGLDRANQQPPFLTTVAIPYRRMIEAALAEIDRGRGTPTAVKHLDFVGDVLEGKTVASISR